MDGCVCMAEGISRFEAGRRLDRRQFLESCLAAWAGLAGGALLSSGCSRKPSAGATYPVDMIPGITRRAGNVFLFENHNVSHLVWHALGIRHATVVHVDTHDDFRHVDSGKLGRIQRLLREGDYAQLYAKSDLEFSFQQKIRSSDMLFDLGNYLFPCLQDKTISRIYWVVPEKQMDPALAGRLAQHFQRVFKVESPVTARVIKEGLIEFDLFEKCLTVSTLDSLPQMPGGSLLDLDVDFFAFPRALVDDHLPGTLIWDVPEVCRRLTERVPDPAVTTICVDPATLPTAAGTPHKVTLVTSPMRPLHKFVPVMIT